MKKSLCIPSVIGLAWLLLSGGKVFGDVTFLDTFTVDTETNNLGYLAAVRQSGTAAPLNYQTVAVNLTGNPYNPNWWLLGSPSANGSLLLEGICNQSPGVGVSAMPLHSFTEGTQFTVDFDIIPFSNTAAGGWCGVKILDSTGTAQFANGGNGFGMLINSDGSGGAFDGETSLATFPTGTFTPTVSNHVTLSVNTGGFDGSSSGQTTVNLTVNGNLVNSYFLNHNYKGNYISLFYALAAVGKVNMTAFDNLEVQTVASVAYADASTVATTVGNASGVMHVIVPASLLATESIDVTLAASDPTIATPTGGTGGSLTLHFAQGATNVQAFTVTGIAQGKTSLTLQSSEVASPTAVGVGVGAFTHSLVANPSFELGPPGVWPAPGYCFLDEWTPNSATSGLNGTATGLGQTVTSLADNGLTPDRELVAFIDGNGSFQQNLSGLAVGSQHWLQFRYDVGDNTYYGGGPVANHVLLVTYNGQFIGGITNPAPVEGGGSFTQPWSFANFKFVPTAASGALVFQHLITDSSGNHATMFVDAVSVALRGAGEVVVQNPSFEASGEPLPVSTTSGFFEPNVNISGWTVSPPGTSWGVNAAGDPFFDNGVAPDQDLVLVVQGINTSVSQTIQGLISGSSYQVSFACNAYSGATPPALQVNAGSAQLLATITAVGTGNPFLRTNLVFTASGATAVLSFNNTESDDPSSTLLLDDVHVQLSTSTAPQLSISRGAGNTVLIQWPASATGYVLQTSSPKVTGPYTDSNLTVTPQGGQNVVTDNLGAGPVFYRLHLGP